MEGSEGPRIAEPTAHESRYLGGAVHYKAFLEDAPTRILSIVALLTMKHIPGLLRSLCKAQWARDHRTEGPRVKAILVVLFITKPSGR